MTVGTGFVGAAGRACGEAGGVEEMMLSVGALVALLIAIKAVRSQFLGFGWIYDRVFGFRIWPDPAVTKVGGGLWSRRVTRGRDLSL